MNVFDPIKCFWRYSFFMLSALIFLNSCGEYNRNRFAVTPKTNSGSQGPSDKTLPQGKVVKYNLKASATELYLTSGEKTKVWAYNNSVPGPILRANVGDTLEVHFENNLIEPTTVHWHGLELPANMDGSHISQLPIKPGESFVYKFRLLREGTYWYHPHINNKEQLERGLYGALIVSNPESNQKFNLPKREEVIILDDILLDKSNQIESFNPSFDPIKKATQQLNGRMGNRILVNGKSFKRIELNGNEPIRLHFINAANSRFFNLSFDEGFDIYRISGDLDLLDKPEPFTYIKPPKKDSPYENYNEGILLTPGDRIQLVIYPKGKVGSSINLYNYDFKRGMHEVIRTHKGSVPFDVKPAVGDGYQSKNWLMAFNISDKKSSFDSDIGSESRLTPKLKPFSGISKKEVQEALKKKPLVVTFGHTLPNKDGDIKFFAQAIMKNGRMKGLPMSKITEELALKAKVGETRILEIRNMTAAIHPFHIHGFAFYHLNTMFMDRENKEACKKNKMCIVKKEMNPKKEWMDTIAIKPRPGFRGKSMSVTRLVVKFDDSGRENQVEAYGKVPTKTKSGGWLMHCHILEHSDKGMATYLSLKNPK